MKTHSTTYLDIYRNAFTAAVLIGLVFGCFQTSQAQIPAKDHKITLQDALMYVKNFRNNPTAPTIQGGTFNRAIFDQILAQDSCYGIRFYFAKKTDGSPTIVIIGVNLQGNDMATGIIGEEMGPCPPYCDISSPLTK